MWERIISSQVEAKFFANVGLLQLLLIVSTLNISFVVVTKLCNATKDPIVMGV